MNYMQAYVRGGGRSLGGRGVGRGNRCSGQNAAATVAAEPAEPATAAEPSRAFATTANANAAAAAAAHRLQGRPGLDGHNIS